MSLIRLTKLCLKLALFALALFLMLWCELAGEGKTAEDLAILFGVCRVQISRIVKRTRWAKL